MSVVEFCITVLNQKKSLKIKGFPENGGVLNIKPRFHYKKKGFVNLRGVFVNNNLKIIIEGL